MVQFNINDIKIVIATPKDEKFLIQIRDGSNIQFGLKKDNEFISLILSTFSDQKYREEMIYCMAKKDKNIES